MHTMISKASPMKTTSHLPQNGIIVPTDFTDASRTAFFHALKLALSMRTHLRMIHVEPPNTEHDVSKFPHVRNTLMVWEKRSTPVTDIDLQNLGLSVKKLTATGNDPSVAIAESLEKHPDQLLVLAPRKISGIKNLWHKSVAVSIMHRTQSQCLFVPEGCKPFIDNATGNLNLKNILFPINETPDPQIALDIASDLVTKLQLPSINAFRLHAGNLKEQLPMDIPDDHPWRWQTIFGMGEPKDIILEEARAHNIDLIVMVTRGKKSFLDNFRGSITEKVARHAPCPVLTIYERTEAD